MARHRVTKVSLVADVGGFVRDVRAGKTATSDLRQEAERFSRGRYGATIKADTSKARTEVTALEKRLQALGKTPVEGRVNLDTDEARDRLRQLQTRLSEFGTRVSDVRLGVDDAEAQGKISRVEASLLALGRRTADPDIDLEGVAAAEAELTGLTGKLNRFDGNTYEANVRIDGMAQMTKSASLLVDTVTMLGPALVPVAAAAAAPIASMTTGMLGAAAAGGSALAAFQGVGEALKALDEGDPEKIAEAMAKLNGAGRSFVRFLDNARPELNQLQNVARSGMFPGMEAGLRDLIELGPVWTRIVRNSSRALGQLAREGGNALNSPHWRQFFDFIATDANRAMVQMGRSAGNVAEGLAGMVMAMDPAADDFSRGLLRMTRRFSAWGRNLESNKQFQEFVDYVQRVSPEVWKTLATVADAMLEIAEAAAPVGEATLPVIRAVASALGAIADSQAGPVIIGTAVALATMNRALRTFEAIKASSLATMMTGVGRESGKASRGMRAFGGAMIGLVGASLVVAGIEKLQDAIVETLPGLNELTNRIRDVGSGQRSDLGKEFDSLGDSIKRITDLSFGDKAFGVFGIDAKSLREARSEVESLDGAMAGLVTSDGPAAARRQFRQLALAQNLNKREQRALLEQMPMFREALEGAGVDADKAARGLTAAERATERLGQELARLGRRLEGRQTLRDYRNAIRDFNEQIRKGPDNLRRGTRAWDDAEEKLDGIAAGALAVANRMRGANKVQFLQQARRDFVDAAAKMLGSRKAARRLADDLGLVNQKGKIQIRLRSTGMDKATQDLRKLKERADRVPRNIDTRVKGNTKDADRDLRVIDKKMRDLDNDVAVPKADLNTKPHDQANRRTRDDLRDLDRQRPTPKAELDTSKARRDQKNWISDFQRNMRRIRDEPVDINLSTKASKVWRGINDALMGAPKGQTGPGLQERATGGRITGHSPTPTADNILVRATAGEMYIRQPSTKRLDREHPGALDYINATGRLPEAHAMGGRVGARLGQHAQGGPRSARSVTSGIARDVNQYAAEVSKELTKRTNEMLLSMRQTGGGLTPEQVSRGQQFARRQHGKPYVWGGVGPGGYDCSGFQSAIFNAALGRSPYSRLFATGSIAGFPPLRPGKGAYNIGWFTGSPGHVSGEIGGLKVESTGDHVRVGSGARSPRDPMFNRHGQLTSAAGRKLGGGFTIGGEYDGGSVRGIVRNAAAARGWDTGAQWRAIVDLIGGESAWNPKAQNPTSSAYGIFQFLDSTWGSVNGHKTSDPAMQSKYGMRYIKQRYGGPIAANRFKHAHNWYDDGGMFTPFAADSADWLGRRGGAGRWWHPRENRPGPRGNGGNASGKPEPVFSASQWATLKKAITALTLNRGRPITTEWLERMISPAVKDIRLLHREFVQTRDHMRAIRVRTERADRRLDRIRDSDRFERRDEIRDKADKAFKAARSGEEIGEDIGDERRDVRRSLRRARRSPIGRDALRDYHKAVRKLEKKRSEDVVEEATKRTKWRKQEARDALRSEQASIRNARDDLKKARDEREDAETKEEKKRARRAVREARQELRQARKQPDSVREKQAREEIKQADRRLKKLGEEAKEIEKLEKARDRAGGQSDAVKELVASRKKIEDLREERKERRELAREARKAGRADILVREEKAEQRLTERIKAQKEARKEATKAAQAYKAAQEAAIESARAETETLRGQVDLFGGFLSPRGAQRQVDDAIERITDYAQNMAQLRKMGVNPWLLEQLRAQGPTDAGVRLGNALLADKGALSRLSQSTAALGSLTERVGAVTGDPRFVSNMPWNPTGQVSTKTLNVDIKALDISNISGEIRRQVRHEVSAMVSAGEV